jgi:hypothetical protein
MPFEPDGVIIGMVGSIFSFLPHCNTKWLNLGAIAKQEKFTTVLRHGRECVVSNNGECFDSHNTYTGTIARILGRGHFEEGTPIVIEFQLNNDSQNPENVFLEAVAFAKHIEDLRKEHEGYIWIVALPIPPVRRYKNHTAMYCMYQWYLEVNNIAAMVFMQNKLIPLPLMGYLERQPKRMANNRIVEWYSAALDQKTEEEQSIENYHRLAKLLDIIIQAKENMKKEMAKLKKENRRKFAYYEKNFTYEEHFLFGFSREDI